MMKALFLHSDFIEVEAKQRAIKDAEEDVEKNLRVEEALVVFSAVEEGDKDIESTAQAFVDEVKDVMEKVKVKRVVIYPFVHLTNKPSDPKTALEILKKAEEILKKEGIEVYRAPFGWYKAFNIKVKGHPLAELSRVVKPKEVKVEAKYEKRFVILFPDGRDYLILGEENNKIKVVPFEKIKERYVDINKISEELEISDSDVGYLDKSLFNEDFVAMLDKEALGKPFEEIDRNPVREALEKFGLEWEPLSDYGHMRYRPYIALMSDLVADYMINLVREFDYPVFTIKGTNMFDLKSGPVAEHAKLYGDRLYELETDKSKFVLRYAACFQQFAMAKDFVISYKNIPFGMLEVADSYRFEQPGETLLGFRMRKFVMPDLHVFCPDDVKEAWKWFMYMHSKIMEEIKRIGRDYELLINVGMPKFYVDYKDLILQFVKDVNKPALLCIYPPEESRYWIVNIEYHIIDLIGRPREIGTTQIDIGNAKRFEIKYIDDKNEEHYPIILHNAVIGSIERYIYAIFDTALRKEKPVLPLWLSPVQVRVIPVSDKHVEYAIKVARELDRYGIRVEVDDRDETVAKKIRDAERLWVPYVVVIGDKEIESGKLSVRVRESGEQKEMQVDELILEIEEKVRDYPRRPLYSPMLLSQGHIAWK